ncbi:MAG: hypothetical protein OXB95_02430 [Rhodobacteraceae bacterium]|nr:hypothetical protein [Paracoccaceae bacterium]
MVPKYQRDPTRAISLAWRLTEDAEDFPNLQLFFANFTRRNLRQRIGLLVDQLREGKSASLAACGKGERAN